MRKQEQKPDKKPARKQELVNVNVNVNVNINNRNDKKDGKDGKAAKDFPVKRIFNWCRREAAFLFFVVALVVKLEHMDNADEIALSMLCSIVMCFKKVIRDLARYLCQKYCPQYSQLVCNSVNWVAIVIIILIWGWGFLATQLSL